MSPGEDDMDWEPIPSAHSFLPRPLAHITVLPFDIFLELVHHLDVWEVLQLRLV